MSWKPWVRSYDVTKWQWQHWAWEVPKQILDQSLHAAAVWIGLYALAWSLWTIPLVWAWYEFLIAREKAQGESPRPWDKSFDYAGYATGAAIFVSQLA